jgi:hypothetical protein
VLVKVLIVLAPYLFSYQFGYILLFGNIYDLAAGGDLLFRKNKKYSLNCNMNVQLSTSKSNLFAPNLIY